MSNKDYKDNIDKNTSIDQNLKKWQELSAKELKDKSFESLAKTDQSGLKYKPLYTKYDLCDNSRIKSSQFPGIAPFIRGPRATMYPNRPWTIRQYAGFSSAKESNEFYKNNLAAGQKGLSVAFDLPTHRGYDSDHPLAKADVGKAGVAIDSVEDMKILFDGIPLDKMTVSMTMNGAVLPILACYIVCAQEQGVKISDLRGTIQNDILKEYLVRNTYIYPPKPSMAIVSDIIAYVAEYMPKYNPISISGYHMQEAGADIATELAYTIANGLEYIRYALQSGLDIDDFASRLSFFFGIGMNFFMEVAKLRAARLLWHDLVKKFFKPKKQKSLMLRVHCQTSGYSLTAQDPYNNIIRTTIEAMAAALGGTQSLHTNSFDEALALPSKLSARVARNTQLILQHETDLTYTADPLAGSYMVESLTMELYNKASEIIKDIENLGGMLNALDYEFVKERIEKSSAAKQARLDSAQDILVGVNAYQLDDENIDNLNIRKIDLSIIQKNQFDSLAKVKKNRDNKKVKSCLAKITDIAQKKLLIKGDINNFTANVCQNSKNNLMPVVIEAIKNRATIGEVSLALEKVFTRYKPKMTMINTVYKDSSNEKDKFNQLSLKLDKFVDVYGRRPRVLLVKLGQDGHDRGIKVVAGGLSDIGFDVDLAPLFLTAKDAAKQAMENDVHFVGVSSLAGAHLSLIKDLKKYLISFNCSHVKVFVGGIIPVDDYQDLYDIGCDQIFAQGTTITECASMLLNFINEI